MPELHLLLHHHVSQIPQLGPDVGLKLLRLLTSLTFGCGPQGPSLLFLALNGLNRDIIVNVGCLSPAKIAEYQHKREDQERPHLHVEMTA